VATNKHEVIRVKKLDKFLRNKGRINFIDDLIDCCNQSIYEFIGKEDGVKIRQAVESVTGIKLNFTLKNVRNQIGIPSYAENDRTIYTNYIRVYSGDTFNYFKANGSKHTKGR
jgi:hypothetical protein